MSPNGFDFLWNYFMYTGDLIKDRSDLSKDHNFLRLFKEFVMALRQHNLLIMESETNNTRVIQMRISKSLEKLFEKRLELDSMHFILHHEMSRGLICLITHCNLMRNLLNEGKDLLIPPHFLKDFQEFETALTEQNLLFTEREMEKAFRFLEGDTGKTFEMGMRFLKSLEKLFEKKQELNFKRIMEDNNIVGYNEIEYLEEEFRFLLISRISIAKEWAKMSRSKLEEYGHREEYMVRHNAIIKTEEIVNKFEANPSNETYWDFMESLETTGEILIHA